MGAYETVQINPSAATLSNGEVGDQTRDVWIGNALLMGATLANNARERDTLPQPKGGTVIIMGIEGGTFRVARQ